MCFFAQSIVKKSVADARRASARRCHPTSSYSSVEFAKTIWALDAGGRSHDCGGQRDALDEAIVSMLCARLIVRCSTLCKSCQDSGDLVFLFFPWVYALLAQQTMLVRYWRDNSLFGISTRFIFIFIFCNKAKSHF